MLHTLLDTIQMRYQRHLVTPSLVQTVQTMDRDMILIGPWARLVENFFNLKSVDHFPRKF